MLLKFVVAVALATAALVIALMGIGREGRGRTVWLPVLILALFAILASLKFLLEAALVVIAMVAILLLLLHLLRGRLFGAGKGSLWAGAAVLAAIYYGLLFLFKWLALR